MISSLLISSHLVVWFLKQMELRLWTACKSFWYVFCCSTHRLSGWASTTLTVLFLSFIARRECNIVRLHAS